MRKITKTLGQYTGLTRRIEQGTS